MNVCVYLEEYIATACICRVVRERGRESERVLSGADLGTALIISPRKKYIQPMTGPLGMHTVIGPGLHPDSLRTIYTWRDAKGQMVQRKTFPLENNWLSLCGCCLRKCPHFSKEMFDLKAARAV